MKYVLVFCLMVCLGLGHVNAGCNDECPETEKVVWALGSGGGCSVFRNKCFFDKDNCTRRPALTAVTKRECQKQCPEICPQIFAPVTAYYKGEVRNFGNQCEMIVHSCRTGETFLNKDIQWQMEKTA